MVWRLTMRTLILTLLLTTNGALGATELNLSSAVETAIAMAFLQADRTRAPG